ncbi:MAG: glycosyltransferase family 2 protein [Spongiibacter sp.]|jgi:glycosyltransferase involved in cell wall biosynthesis|uniref:glycosyltransferase family 2 protein n=1 Tax=Gammaproteobacteria TaxID=1236 RepID=UPI001B16B41E|nr:MULTISPECIES: glycosyltransferase family 2 protein [Spongiibacter]MBO6752568.1 glycosyltransferase family 2 protein [Spongiibacter sp.]|tara:strand:+ start:748 stop:1776 length:1029 start_codon:yes stop_codon:yes gene_type:complete
MSLQSDPQQATRRELLLSIVVPVFNERTMLPVFLENLLPILQSLALKSEVVFVDDGSQDGSAEYLKQMISKMPGIKLLKLSRNFGKEAAVTAGLEHCGGDAVIVMDADLQDPPKYIPAMVDAWQSGSEVVLMQRRCRNGDSRLKRLSAHLFYRLLNVSSRTEIPVDTGDFRLMSRKAIDALLSLNERNRYMKGLYAWIGMPTHTLQYEREPRVAGETKWSYPALVGLAFEGLTSFSVSPLRWAIGLGILSATSGLAWGLWIFIKALLVGDPTSGYPSLVSIITFLGGVQLFSIGIVGEYIGKIYLETKQRPIYIAEKIIESQQAKYCIRSVQQEPFNNVAEI